jgi:hypothetical protein
LWFLSHKKAKSFLQEGADDKVTIVAKRQTFARSKSQKTYYSMPASQGLFLIIK